MAIGNRRLLTAYIRDITERKEAERRALHLAIVATSDNAIIGKRLDGTIVSWNRGAEKLYGYVAREVIGKHISILAPDGAGDDICDILEPIARGEHVDHFETKRRTKWGDDVYVSLTVSPLIDATGAVIGASAIGRDITAQKRAEERMEYMAYHDPLTGLPDRAMFQEHLGLALERAKRHDLTGAVLNVDLDDFKLVNDRFGHEAGDELLRQAGRRLQSVTRSTDLVARHGGDEFLILLGDLPRGGGGAGGAATDLTQTIARHVEHDLHELFELAGSQVYAKGSIGCSIFPLDAETPESLLAQADLAMYQAKRASRGITGPSPGRPIGCPSPALADGGAAQGAREGRVRLNIPLTILQPPAVAKLLASIRQAGIDPALFTLEVTESATMTNPEHTQRLLHSLRTGGVNLAVDDFGTGYSSLARLTQMPVTTLKIDRAFIREVPHDESATAVAKTIIQLAHGLGAHAVAEGIETREQLRFLVEQGCRVGQGFLFSKPLPADQIPGFHGAFSRNGHR